MARVNLYTELYENLIHDRGIDAIWERACVCKCVSRDSGQPDFTCPICGGSGYRYMDGKPIRVAVTSIMSDYRLDTLMLREPGTAYITPKADIIMGFHDRLVFPDFKCTFSEVIHWNYDEDGLGVSPKTYRDIKSVIFMADGENEYEEHIDFEVTEDKFHLKWKDIELAKKYDGTNMSLLYYTTPSYLVDDLLHEIRATISDRNSPKETFRELPKQYKIVREDFMYKVKTPEPFPDEPREEIVDNVETNTDIPEQNEPISDGEGTVI